MKIGILTHHYVKNYGAFLQMKGMYETLQRLYPEAAVTVINYVNQKHWRRNIIHILHFRPGVDTLSTYVEKIRQLRTFTKYERSIPRTRPVKTAKEIIDLKLDLIVLGSDEIWNLCGSGYHPLKFGTGLENQRTIAYAPSVGAVTEETAVPEDVLSGLKHLDRISGRDVESLKFVERACGRKAEKMLDPTFLYNFDTDIERENIKPKPYRYILIYDCKLTEDLGIRVLLYWMSPNGKQALLQYRFRNVKNLKIYLCQIYWDSLKTYNNRAMRLLREECRHEFWASYEPASDNSGGKPENECWERCYPYSWESGLYLRFAEERSEVYCNHAVCCGASHVL